MNVDIVRLTSGQKNEPTKKLVEFDIKIMWTSIHRIRQFS